MNIKKVEDFLKKNQLNSSKINEDLQIPEYTSTISNIMDIIYKSCNNKDLVSALSSQNYKENLKKYFNLKLNTSGKGSSKVNKIYSVLKGASGSLQLAVDDIKTNNKTKGLDITSMIVFKLISRAIETFDVFSDDVFQVVGNNKSTALDFVNALDSLKKEYNFYDRVGVNLYKDNIRNENYSYNDDRKIFSDFINDVVFKPMQEYILKFSKDIIEVFRDELISVENINPNDIVEKPVEDIENSNIENDFEDNLDQDSVDDEDNINDIETSYEEDDEEDDEEDQMSDDDLDAMYDKHMNSGGMDDIEPSYDDESDEDDEYGKYDGEAEIEAFLKSQGKK